MSVPNSRMTIHTLVLIVDRFSLHCNSIQSPVSIVHLRVILTYLIPLLRVYINYSISNAYSVQFSSNMYSNVTTSTRINILQCTYVHLCLFHSKLHSTIPIQFSNGLLTNNSTQPIMVSVMYFNRLCEKAQINFYPNSANTMTSCQAS